jgi:uncharacterized protein (DUF433 family)
VSVCILGDNGPASVGPEVGTRRNVAIERITIELGNMGGQPCIRGLPIKFWDVYRDLTLHGMTEDEVLQKYSELEPDDIPAVREYAVQLIKTRTHDEVSGRPILPKDRLVHGRYYKGRCRNATVARWNSEKQKFYHWREKFGRIYIETIKYPTDEREPWWDVFDVVEEVPNPRFEIPFDHEAAFFGNRNDLCEYDCKMWSRPK